MGVDLTRSFVDVNLESIRLRQIRGKGGERGSQGLVVYHCGKRIN